MASLHGGAEERGVPGLANALVVFSQTAEDGEIEVQISVHRLMLDDNARTQAYKQAILSQANYFSDKVVLDVGAGTGILSLFCAQAGARKVYAVEASRLSSLAERIVINKTVENVCLPEDEKVDVIVSEWMGFYLLHEGMLDSVLTARDKFLKPDGKLFPDIVSLYSAPCSLPKFYDHWEEFHGLDLSPLGDEERRLKGSQPDITEVNKDDLLASHQIVCELDLYKTSSKDLDSISSRQVFSVSREGRYQGVCLWFDCSFPSISLDATRVVLSTSPHCQQTHWKQTVLVLPEEMYVTEGDPLAWELILERGGDDWRHYNIQCTLLDPEEERHPVPCECLLPKCCLIREIIDKHAQTLGSQE
uniref:Protein arginine N-methyltransferase domain-containing protein n=1 Tax=Timema bartmani TaxID=61472 RepID=A0A7R9I3Q2_9NEOP|nr:unnamed protein product [Timema bartmani]